VCRRLRLSRQAFYQGRRQRKRQAVDEALVLELVAEQRRYHPRMGTRKLHVCIKAELVIAKVKVGRDRLFEVLRWHDLLVERHRAEYPTTTNSYHCLPVFHNLVRNLKVSWPNEVWVSDLTYLRTEEGFLFLALITDKKSRKIVGFHCGDTLEASGCLKALDMALRELPEGARPIHHSDRGCQYCSHEYVNILVDRGLRVSMTEEDHCAENALAERVNGILKSEYGLGYRLPSKAAARVLVHQSVHLYNHRRPHTALAFRTPVEVHALTA
jgi:transposase InsO family protein